MLWCWACGCSAVMPRLNVSVWTTWTSSWSLTKKQNTTHIKSDVLMSVKILYSGPLGYEVMLSGTQGNKRSLLHPKHCPTHPLSSPHQTVWCELVGEAGTLLATPVQWSWVDEQPLLKFQRRQNQENHNIKTAWSNVHANVKTHHGCQLCLNCLTWIYRVASLWFRTSKSLCRCFFLSSWDPKFSDPEWIYCTIQYGR